MNQSVVRDLSILDRWPPEVRRPALLTAILDAEPPPSASLITHVLRDVTDPTLRLWLLLRTPSRAPLLDHLEAHLDTVQDLLIAEANARLRFADGDRERLVRADSAEAAILGVGLALIFARRSAVLPERYDPFLQYLASRPLRPNAVSERRARLFHHMVRALRALPLSRRESVVLASRNGDAPRLSWELARHAQVLTPTVARQAAWVAGHLATRAQGSRTVDRLEAEHRGLFAALGALAVPPLIAELPRAVRSDDIIRALGATGSPEAIPPLMTMLGDSALARDALSELVFLGHEDALIAACHSRLEDDLPTVLAALRLLPPSPDRDALITAVRRQPLDAAIRDQLTLLQAVALDADAGRQAWLTLRGHPDAARWENQLHALIEAEPQIWRQTMLREADHWPPIRRALSLVWLVHHPQHDSNFGASDLVARYPLPASLREAVPWGVLEDLRVLRYDFELLNLLRTLEAWIGHPPLNAIRATALRRPEQREAIYQYLSQKSPLPEMVDIFIEGLSDPRRAIRHHCIDALWRMGAAAVSPLLGFLNEADHLGQQGAAAVLGILAPVAAIDTLKATLDRADDADAARALEVALRRCQSQQLPT